MWYWISTKIMQETLLTPKKYTNQKQKKIKIGTYILSTLTCKNVAQ